MKYWRFNVNKINKLQWKDELINILNVPNEKYTPLEIEQFLKEKFLNGKNSKFLNFDNNQWNILKIPGWKKKIRLSYFMNHIIHKFIINNDRPTTKYFSNDFDFYALNDTEVTKILSTI